MRLTIPLVVLLMSSVACFAGTNNNLQTLSGTLQKARLNDLRPYYLEIFIAGGGTQKVWLTGKIDPNLVKAEVKVRGEFKTSFLDSVPPQPQPSGWIIWMVVEELTQEMKRPESNR